jgi:hypothetical protein
MDLKLTDRIALVSGSTAGIGLAIATCLAQEGAIYGQSFGLQGNTYAIITKDLNKGLRSIPLPQIKSQIDKLWELARHSNHDYLLTPIGTGNAGYSIPEITKLLPKSIPHNIWIPECYAHLKCNLSPKNMMNVMFTGNRIQKFNSISERDDAYAHLEKLIHRAIARGIEWGHDSINFISGMALGVDTAACQFVLDQKSKGHHIDIIMTAAVPCLDQDNKCNYLINVILSSMHRISIMPMQGGQVVSINAINAWCSS